jgi:hypothetical protein
MKEFVVKDNAGFKLKVKSWKCKTPADLNAIEFIQESKNKDGEADLTSTYQFFMTDKEIAVLCEGLLK